MSFEILNSSLEGILKQYQYSFLGKAFAEESSEEDDLMFVFGLTQDIKVENRQYWGRELGKCWERLVKELCRQTCSDFSEPKSGDGRYDLMVGHDAIETKYRIGSGDAKTLNGFRKNGRDLTNQGFRPILLILRNDSLPQALAACRDGGWIIKSGRDAYEYIYDLTRFDLQAWFHERRNSFFVERQITERIPNLDE